MSQPERFERQKEIIDEMSWGVALSVGQIAKESGAQRQRSMVVPREVVEMLFENDTDPDHALYVKISRIPALAERVARQATAKVQLKAEMLLQMAEKGPMTNQELVTGIFGADALQTQDE